MPQSKRRAGSKPARATRQKPKQSTRRMRSAVGFGQPQIGKGAPVMVSERINPAAAAGLIQAAAAWQEAQAAGS